MHDPDTPTIREALEEMCYHFAYETAKDGQPAIWTGGLSTLEDAFDALGWDDPHIVPDPVRCDGDPTCVRFTTSGTPTPDGYKRFCPDHFHLWEAAQRTNRQEPPTR